MGDMPLHVEVQGKEAPIKVTLKGLLWIPVLPCRLLSSGTIRRDGGEIVDSGTKKSCLRFRKYGPKIPLTEKKIYVDPVVIRTTEWQLCGISACFCHKQETASNIESMERHLGAH